MCVTSKHCYCMLFMMCNLFDISIDFLVTGALTKYCLCVLFFSECEMHFCKYYIDGNIGEGN